MDINEITKQQAAEISKELSWRSQFQKAPELLLENIMELQKILVNFKAKNGENETYKKFEQILKSMQHSWNFINDIGYISMENTVLRQEVGLLKQLLRFNQSELDNYRSIEASLLDGTLENKIEVVKRKNQ